MDCCHRFGADQTELLRLDPPPRAIGPDQYEFAPRFFHSGRGSGAQPRHHLRASGWCETQRRVLVEDKPNVSPALDPQVRGQAD